jgi:LacI family transcriptional regulator
LVKDDHLKFIREKLEPEGVRLATVAHTPNYDSVIDITANDRQGISLAVEHLTGLGHRKIAYLGMHPDLLYGIRRRQGFYDGMAKHGLSVPESYCLHSIDVREIDEYLLRLIKSSSNRPSAIICASDMYALRAITLFLKIGVRVPEDVSVLGYGETTACRYSTPSITTIAEPYERIGQTLANKLITAIKNGSRKTTPVHETLDVSLIQRESTGPLISTHGKG